VYPSASSAAGASVESYTPVLSVAAPASEVGSVGPDQALAGRGADVRACAGARPDNDNDDGGSRFSGKGMADSYIPPSSTQTSARDYLRSATRSLSSP
jgi:hypothetical protein